MQKKEASEEISLILADKKEPIINRFGLFFFFVGLDFFPCIQQLIREDADRNTFERVQIYTV